MAVSYPSPRGITPTYVVEGVTTAAPPSGLANYQMWLVASAFTSGIFVGRENQLATFIDGQGWRFSTPTQSETVYDKANSLYWRLAGGVWVIDSDFNSLGTTTAIPSSHFAQSLDYSFAGFPFALQTGAPIGVYRFTTAAAATGVYEITVANPCFVLDAVLYQHAVAGGAGCTVEIETDAAAIFPAFTCDQGAVSVQRPEVTAAGLTKLGAGAKITVTATDVGGKLPATTVLVTFALGV